MKARPKEAATRNHGPRKNTSLFRVMTKIADISAGRSFLVRYLTRMNVLKDIMKTRTTGRTGPISSGEIPVKRLESAIKRL